MALAAGSAPPCSPLTALEKKAPRSWRGVLSPTDGFPPLFFVRLRLYVVVGFVLAAYSQ
jgi:hypothetical protein